MNILFFDVSSTVMYIGYAQNNEIIDFSIRLAKRDHAKYMVERIRQLLERNKVSIHDMDIIIVGRGPGSYTGLRIAGTVAKTLAYSTNIPLYEVSSLIFMTSGYKGLVAGLQDARRGNVFSIIYDENQIYLKDALRAFDDLKEQEIYKKSNTILVNEDTYKVNIEMIKKYMTRVNDVHAYEPFYARITEAEQRANQKSDTE